MRSPSSHPSVLFCVLLLGTCLTGTLAHMTAWISDLAYSRKLNYLAGSVKEANMETMFPASGPHKTKATTDSSIKPCIQYPSGPIAQLGSEKDTKLTLNVTMAQTGFNCVLSVKKWTDEKGAQTDAAVGQPKDLGDCLSSKGRFDHEFKTPKNTGIYLVHVAAKKGDDEEYDICVDISVNEKELPHDDESKWMKFDPDSLNATATTSAAAVVPVTTSTGAQSPTPGQPAGTGQGQVQGKPTGQGQGKPTGQGQDPNEPTDQGQDPNEPTDQGKPTGHGHATA